MKFTININIKEKSIILNYSYVIYSFFKKEINNQIEEKLIIQNYYYYVIFFS